MDTEASDLYAGDATVERKQEELEALAGRGKSGVGRAPAGKERSRREGCWRSQRSDRAGERRTEKEGLGHGVVGNEGCIL